MCFPIRLTPALDDPLNGTLVCLQEQSESCAYQAAPMQKSYLLYFVILSHRSKVKVEQSSLHASPVFRMLLNCLTQEFLGCEGGGGGDGN